MSESSILLDTHIWIWLNQGASTLATSTIQWIDAIANEGAVYISAISVWEIATLVAKKKIILTTSVSDWVKRALELPGVQLLPLSPEIAIESTLLPEGFHADPADRIIVASARLHDLTLLTRDQKIIDYGQHHFLKVKVS